MGTDTGKNNRTAQERPLERALERPAPMLRAILYLLSFIAGVSFWRDMSGFFGLAGAVLAGAFETALALGYTGRRLTLTAFLPGAAAYLAAFVCDLTVGGLSALRAAADALTALYPTVAAIPIWLTVRGKKNRSESIAASASASAVFWTLFAGLQVLIFYGDLGADTIRLALSDFMSPLGDALSSLTFDHGNSSLPFLGDADIEAVLDLLKRTLIGSVGAILTAMSYLMTLALRYFSECFGIDSLLPSSTRLIISESENGEKRIDETDLGWRIEPDSVSATVMLISYMLTILLGGLGSALPFTTAIYNIVLILTPCFFYAGVRSVICCFTGSPAMNPGGSGRIGGIGRGCLIITVSALLFFVAPTSPIVLLTGVGVISVLTENHTRLAADYSIDDNDRKE